jgi:hypothetical protein
LHQALDDSGVLPGGVSQAQCAEYAGWLWPGLDTATEELDEDTGELVPVPGGSVTLMQFREFVNMGVAISAVNPGCAAY